MTKDKIDEIALRVAEQVAPDGWLCGSDPVLDYTHALLAELSKDVEHDYCHSDFELAKMIMSDCGISTINNENLTSRIADRIANTRPHKVIASEQKPVKLQRPVFKCIDCGFIQFGHENCPHSGGHQMLAIDLFSHPANTAEIEQRVAEACASLIRHYLDNRIVYADEAIRSGKWREYQ